MTAQKGKERGAALITVLWLSLLLSTLMAAALLSVRTEARLAAADIRLFKARQAIDSAITLAAYRLATERGSVALELISQPIMIGETSVTIDIVDEAAKLDLNTANAAAIAGVLIQKGLDVKDAQRLADIVLDWRDEDDLRRINGAEAKDYKREKAPFAPQNRPFLDINELTQVLGFENGLAACLMDDVTIFGRTVAPLVIQQTPVSGENNPDADQPRAPRRLTTQTVSTVSGKRFTLTGSIRTEAMNASNAYTILTTSNPKTPFEVIAKRRTIPRLGNAQCIVPEGA
ncbi:MAG: hypothetical protein AAGA09_09140 [Pseudomonadota bacterium]